MYGLMESIVYYLPVQYTIYLYCILPVHSEFIGISIVWTINL